MNKFGKILLMVLEILPALLEKMIVYWPGTFGHYLRYGWYKCRLAHLGRKARIDFGVHIINPSMIRIGDHTHIDRHVTLAAGPVQPRGRKIHPKQNPDYSHDPGQIYIGRNVHIAPYAYLVGAGGIRIEDDCGIACGCRIFSVSHHYANPADPQDTTPYSFTTQVPDSQQSLIVSPVVMKQNSAVGLHSVVLPGSTLGKNAWVGVLSCVRGSIPDGVIAAGNPVQVIKKRISSDLPAQGVEAC